MIETCAPAPPLWASLAAPLVRVLPRGRYRAMNRLCRGTTARFVAPLPDSATGLRFECDLRNSLAREVYFTGRYEPQETALVRQLLSPGDTFVDVGAHWGYFSLLAAERLGPTGRVVAIEADPRVFAVLERTCALNQLDGLTAVHAAVADGPGELTLAGFDERQDNWGLSRLVVGPEQGQGQGGATAAMSYRVRAVALDDLLDEHGIGAVDLVKMDIEGAEAPALQGMRRGLESERYRRLLIELHPEALPAFGTTAADLVALILASGYRGYTVDHSLAAGRRAAYAANLKAETLLRPLDPAAPLDAWPHLLFVRAESA